MSGSLRDVSNFVLDALQPQGKPFTAKEPRFGEYGFVPWAKDGMNAVLQSPPAGATRASVVITVPVQADPVQPDVVVKRTVTVRGPGDVTGFDRAQIVRRHPTPGTLAAEPTYLAHVELDRPDFPWMFSPFAVLKDDRIAPWLALVVLAQEHARLEPGHAGLPARVLTRFGELQPLEHGWAWAHAQVIPGGDAALTVADRLGPKHGAANLSRILCPRRLEPDSAYMACVVPAFDAGRHAALEGKVGGTLGPAWSRTPGDEEKEIVLPVFDHWTFATGPDGDFESLAKRLKAVAAPPGIGRRLVDTSRPGGGLPPLAPAAPGRTQVIRCALTSPAQAQVGAPRPSEWGEDSVGKLRDALNRPDELRGKHDNADDEIPAVGPRIYAGLHRGASRVEDDLSPADWFRQINLSPVHRIVAGLGTRVVRADQEALAQAAWAQVGELDVANRELRRAQLAQTVVTSLHRRHLARLSFGDLLQITRGVHGKLRPPGAEVTLYGAAARSIVAPPALTAAFRRMTRTRGPLARFLDDAARDELSSMIVQDGQLRDFRRPYTEPDGVAGLSAEAIDELDPAVVGRVLDEPAGGAQAALRTRVAELARAPSAADALLERPLAGTVPTGRQLAERLSQRLVELAARGLPLTDERARARTTAAGAVLAGVSASGIGSSELATSRAQELAERLQRRPIVKKKGREPAKPLVRDLHTSVSVAIAAALTATASLPAAAIEAAIADLARGLSIATLPQAPQVGPLEIQHASLAASIEASRTVTSHWNGRLGALPSWVPADWFEATGLRPIMAAPQFRRPMYQALEAYDREWLVPGLGSITEPDFLTLLQTNTAFSEAFLVGLSDELGRELLWRGYPTDQRGTYFKRFWDAEDDELSQPIHRFAPTALGTHQPGTEGKVVDRVVFVLRAELLRRYPDAVIMMLRAAKEDPATHKPTFADPATGNTTFARTLFQAHLAPDYALVGFDLTVERVTKEPWWFVIAENPTAPRFGLDDSGAERSDPPEAVPRRDQLTWGDLPMTKGDRRFLSAAEAMDVREDTGGATIKWGSDAATVAHILLQRPVRAAWDASKLIIGANGGGG